jgi:biopolymer transport protein ExbD
LTDWFVRLDVIVLALMLTYVFAVALHVSFRCRLARHARGVDTASWRKLADGLSIEVSNLKSVAFISPYLGLVGTCGGILNAPGIGSGIAMEKNAALALISSGVAAALVTTAAGILVAVPATCFYNHLSTRIDLLQSNSFNDPFAHGGEYRQITGKFPLRRRFSQLPPFALIAAPSLAVLVAVYTAYFSPREPTGLGIELASDRCQDDGRRRLIVLHVTDGGKLFLNAEQEDWNSLATRLSEIYNMRANRTLYLVVDDGVDFQTAADAIDIVQNASVHGSSSSLGITIRLITPIAKKARCPIPVVTGSGQHASRKALKHRDISNITRN